jgi:hypothetical protein
MAVPEEIFEACMSPSFASCVNPNSENLLVLVTEQNRHLHLVFFPFPCCQQVDSAYCEREQLHRQMVVPWGWKNAGLSSPCLFSSGCKRHESRAETLKFHHTSSFLSWDVPFLSSLASLVGPLCHAAPGQQEHQKAADPGEQEQLYIGPGQQYIPSACPGQQQQLKAA